MAARNSAAVADDLHARAFEIERIFDAPRSLVFEAWADPQRAARWWGPQGFTTLSLDMDMRQGGHYRHSMRSPQGTVHTKRGVFREVRRPELLVFTYAWEDDSGELGPETIVTVRLFEQGSATRLTLHQGTFDSVSSCDSHRSGWSGALERYAAYVAALP